jgi:phage FluMu protein gp41
MAAEANFSLLRQSAIVILAQQSAMRAVRRRIQKEGRIKGPLPLSTLSRLANEWLHDHPQLLAEAAASPIVAELIKREGQPS